MREPHHRSAQAWHALSRDHTVLPVTHAFIHEWNKPCLPLPFQPKLVPHLPTQERCKAELAAIADDGWATWWTEQLGNTTKLSSGDWGVAVSDVNRTNITALIGEFYDDFEHVSENYLMTSLAALGIILNILAMVATCRDGHMRPMSRSLQCIFYAAENLFLAGYVGFLQIRGHERRLHRHKEHDLEVFSLQKCIVFGENDLSIIFPWFFTTIIILRLDNGANM